MSETKTEIKIKPVEALDTSTPIQKKRKPRKRIVKKKVQTSSAFDFSSLISRFSSTGFALLGFGSLLVWKYMSKPSAPRIQVYHTQQRSTEPPSQVGSLPMTQPPPAAAAAAAVVEVTQEQLPQSQNAWGV
jgi:hypothetical protein